MPANEILEMIRAEEAVRKLTAAVDQSRTAIRTADAAFQSGTISRGDFRRTVNAETEVIRRNTRELAQHEQTVRKTEQSQRTLQRGAQGAAYGMLYLSQAVEDAQFGFSAVVNNIPLILMSLGVGPGLAGVASLAAVAVNQLGGNLDGLRKAIEGTMLQGALGSGGRMPWEAGGWMRRLSEGFYGALGFEIDPNEGERERRAARAAERAAKKQADAVKKVLAIEANVGAMPELSAGAQKGMGKSAMSGKTLLDRLLEQAGFTAEGQAGETVAVTKAREQMRGNLARMIEGALQGIPGELNALIARLTDRMRPVAGGQALADQLLEALLPANEDLMRRRATEFFTKMAGAFEGAAKSFDFTLPGMTAQGRAKMGAQFQGQMEGLGIAPDMQAQIAQLFSTKAGPARMAALNQIIPLLQSQGATQREVMEALPRIFSNMDRGMNVFDATQQALNQLSRGGMRAFGQGNRQTRQQQQVLSGLGMLGLSPMAPIGQTSRFGVMPGAAAQPGEGAIAPGMGDNFPAIGQAMQGQGNVQAGIIANQAAEAQIINWVVGQVQMNQRDNRAVMQQLNQVGRTAQNRGR